MNASGVGTHGFSICAIVGWKTTEGARRAYDPAGGWGLKVTGVIALVFGFLTIFSEGTALFGCNAARAAIGNAVPVVIWFNFAAGFFYVVAGLGLLLNPRSAVWFSLAIAVATTLVLAAFGLHVAAGGAYEMRAVAAMLLRTAAWVTIAAVSWRSMRR